jgi:hypothetical protein
MHSARCAIVEIAVFLIAGLFLIFISSDVVFKRVPKSPTVLKLILHNFTLPLDYTFSTIPTQLLYDISTKQEGCMVASLLPFAMCGFKKQCSGALWTYGNREKKISIASNNPSCHEFYGYLRAT